MRPYIYLSFSLYRPLFVTICHRSLVLNFFFFYSVGLYGHSAVYHEQTDAVYVFGGYRFHVETVEPSGELYSLYYPNLTWSLLVPSQGNKV